MKKILVYTLITLSFVLVPIALLFDAAGHINPSNFAALAFGVTAYSVMALNLVLAARVRIIEQSLGGLDRVYFLHKWLGVSILVLAILHERIGIEVKGQGATSGLSKLAAEAAEFVFPMLILLGLISVIKRLPKLKFELPYNLWRWSHRIMGLIFAVLIFHQFFVKLPFDNNTLISSYLSWMGLFGLSCFVYSQTAPFLRRRPYQVVSVTRGPAATTIRLSALGKPIRNRAGQFAFVSFRRPGLREAHPFTISSDPSATEVEFSIKPSGDFTRNVREKVEVGDKAWIEGAYGRFETADADPKQIWLAGGIGITPFLAWADKLQSVDTRKIDLFYCVRDRPEAIGIDRLNAAASRVEGLNVHLHVSSEDGRMTAERLAAAADPVGASLWFCGPVQLRHAVLAGLKEIEKKPKSVHFERFEFR